MTLIKVETKNAPAAIGPYSQAIRAGEFLYVSGQLPIDPLTGNIVAGGIKEQTTQVINNILAIINTQQIQEQGITRTAELKDVVKTEVFLKDMNEFAAMNDIYASQFTQQPTPARQTIEAARLPKDVRVEISCIVYLGK